MGRIVEAQSLSQVEVLNSILAVLDSGSMTGTNKVSTLLAIVDLVPQLPPDVFEIDINQLAEKVLEIQWNHTMPFHGGPSLRQLAVRNKDDLVVLKEVKRLQTIVGSSVDYGTSKIRVGNIEWNTSISNIRNSLKANPLKKIQNLGNDEMEFLFSRKFTSNRITLFPVAKTTLLQWGPSIRILIEARFIQFVARLNMDQIEYSEIENYLFGIDRFMPNSEMRKELAKVQNGKCLYTDIQLPTRNTAGSLDHVIPWSKARISAVQNFVLTTDSINIQKSNLLLDYELLSKWIEFEINNETLLLEIAEKFGWQYKPGITSTTLISLYSNLPVGSKLFSKDSKQSLTEKSRSAILNLLKTHAI
jgi:hypothetical protein